MRNRKTRLTVILTFIAILFTIGCQKKVTPHPNQLNAFDGQAYDSLVSAQAALEEAKGQYASGKLPPAAKVIINDAGALYESARTGWLYWRDISMGIKSGDVNEAQARLQDDLAQLSTAIAKVAAIKGAKQ